MKKLLPLLLLLGLSAIAQAHGISEADKQAIVEGGAFRYLWLGAIHMVTGYDHLLFIFGVIFYLKGFKDIVKYITVFTLGHSITLLGATFFRITANYYLVDAVIALSVCYKAFDNLDGFRKYLKFTPPNLTAMIFLFGLIHGFGLSTRLQELPLGSEGFFIRILAFNVGVELGQIAALSVLFVLLSGLRKLAPSRKAGGTMNAMLLAAGVGLFVFQMNGFLRGGGHHHEDAHSHGGTTHSHGTETGILPFAKDSSASDTSFRVVPHAHGAAIHSDSTHPPSVHEHSHGGGHSHSHTHSHSHGERPKPKRPPIAEPKPDSAEPSVIP